MRRGNSCSVPKREDGAPIAAAAPGAPARVELSAGDEHHDLYRAVEKTLFAMPGRFKSDLVITGVLATDLHTFNTSLGATIESQVVECLNELRDQWDPEKRYVGYEFTRQPQTFPDVLLKATAPGVSAPIIMGVELKGWYVLAKEREPSFRFKTTPAVCAPRDLLVVFPWALSSAVSGSPRLFQPFAVPARYAAEYRNWYWQHAKKGKGGDTGIDLSEVNQPYPEKSDQISDKPKNDGGGNFGRFARAGIMDDYMKALFSEQLLGIPLDSWQRFFELFAGRTTLEVIASRLEHWAEKVAKAKPKLDAEQIEELRGHFAAIAEILQD